MVSFSEMFHVSRDTFEFTKKGMEFSGLLGIKMIIGNLTNPRLGWENKIPPFYSRCIDLGGSSLVYIIYYPAFVLMVKK